MAAKCYKSAEKFGSVEKIVYLCGMKTKKPKDAWYVTGLNRLTGQRDQLTGITTHQDAESRMERYQIAAARQKYPTYTRLRLERAVAVQLTFKFTN